MAFETDGNSLPVWYGPQKVASDIGTPGKLRGGSDVRTLVIDFPYNSLPAPAAGAHNQFIPAKSLILEAAMETLVAFTGGTSYDIGLQQSDGTAIDDDGIANDIVIAALNAVGKRVILDPNNTDTYSGALIGHVSSLTLDGYVKVTATGTFTAGKARLEIKYIPPSA